MKTFKLTTLLIAISLLSGCGTGRIVTAYFQSTDSFNQLGDSGIYYEAGAKESAKIIYDLLPSAMKEVEKNQFKPFKKKPHIIVFSDKQSFSKYSGSPLMARGAVFNGKLFISPRAIETKSLKPILTHELSHMHFHQYLGNTKYASEIPSWFQEGLAVLVSNGAGAENASTDVAKKHILKGHSIKPNESGSLFFPQRAYYFGLKTHMFYRQSLMFVSYLKQQYPEQFKAFINMLLENTTFKEAFEKSFGKTINYSWKQFVSTLKT